MKSKLQIVRESLPDIFNWERIICRLIAAWCGFTAYNLSKDANFFELSFAQNIPLGGMILCIALLFVFFSIVNYIFLGIETDSWMMLAGATVCVARWLLKYDYSTNGLLFVLAVSAVYCLFVVYFVNKNRQIWNRWNPSKRTVLIASLLLGVVCGTVIAVITCLRHKIFLTPSFDFGIFVNMFHYMKETGLPLSTIERDVLMSHFAVHVSPIYYLILPFYCVFPSVFTLQIAQAVILASGVIPAMLLCRQPKLSGKATILVVLLYALYPAISTGCFYDIHENCFLPPLLLWMFYFFEKENYALMYISALATLLVKEDAAVYVLLFAIYMILSRKKYLHGCILVAGSLLYFAGAMFFLEKMANHYAQVYASASPNPAINGPMVNRFNNLMLDKKMGLVGALKTALVNPGFLLTQLFTTGGNNWDKFAYVLQMLLPLGFLPFCTQKTSRYLLIAPILLNLLTYYPYQFQISYQYHFGITAFLIYATAVNLPDMKRVPRRMLLSIASAVCFCMYLGLVCPTLKDYRERWKENQDTYTKMEEILDAIPQDVSIASSHMILSHLADRDEIYAMFYHNNEPDVDYVVFDSRYGIDKEPYQAYLDQGYILKEEHEGLITILEKPN